MKLPLANKQNAHLNTIIALALENGPKLFHVDAVHVNLQVHIADSSQEITQRGLATFAACNLCLQDTGKLDITKHYYVSMTTAKHRMSYNISLMLPRPTTPPSETGSKRMVAQLLEDG